MRALCVLSVLAFVPLLACDGGGASGAGGVGGGGVGGAGAGGAGGAGGSGGGGSGGAPLTPPSTFDRFCDGAPWDQTLVPAVPNDLVGDYVGVFGADPFPAGTLETVKVIPAHPFHVRKVRAAFAGEAGGPARLRLTPAYGRTYPGVSVDEDGFPIVDDEASNLMPPLDFTVADEPDPDTWIEHDVSALGIFLEPTQHYLLVLELQGEAPLLAVEDLADGVPSSSLIHARGVDAPYGLGQANFRLELEGDYFCSWTDAERWFGLDAAAPFANEPSGRVSVADVDGDGHDDVLVSAPGPKAFLGDGAGSFAAPAQDPFSDVPFASMLLFGDLDNDGDEDALAVTYVGADGDGDQWTLAEGDCDDTDPSVRPPAQEVSNGKDDDCDGVADDGTDTSDADQDGVSIADGDCDDTRPETFPGATEALNGNDDDCDGAVDEDFFHRVLVNDGAGSFSYLPSPDVEVLEPTPAAALGDADQDGALDVYLGNWLEHYPNYPAVPHRYLRGAGDGTFVEATQASGLVKATPRPAYGVVFHDWNDDGWQDLYVGNYQLSDNYLWKNLGDGTFEDVAQETNAAHDAITGAPPGYPGGHSYGSTFGDVDNDGDMDLFVSNLSHPRTRPWSDPSLMLLSQGAPDYVFADHTADWGVLYSEGDLNAAFGDFDNDMDLDLVIGSVYSLHHTRLYRNDGGHFVDVTYETGTAVEQGVAVVWSDLDEDGDLELLVASGSATPHVSLFVNRVGNQNGWVELLLEGTSTNRDAYGARVELTAAGVTQLRDVVGGGGLSNVQASRIVHFGLGAADGITSAKVRWVGGPTETITGLAPGGRYKVVQGTGVAVPL